MSLAGNFSFNYLGSSSSQSPVAWNNCTAPGTMSIIFEGNIDQLPSNSSGLSIEIIFTVRVKMVSLNYFEKQVHIERSYAPGQTISDNFTEIVVADLSNTGLAGSTIIEVSTELELADIQGVTGVPFDHNYSILGFIEPVGPTAYYDNFASQVGITTSPDLDIPLLYNDNLSAEFELQYVGPEPNKYELQSKILPTIFNPTIPGGIGNLWAFDYVIDFGSVQNTFFDQTSSFIIEESLSCGNQIVSSVIRPKLWWNNVYVPIGCDFYFSDNVCIDQTSEVICERVFCGDSPLRESQRINKGLQIISPHSGNRSLLIQTNMEMDHNVRYEILDTQGRKLVGGNIYIQQGQFKQKISIQHLTNGVYMLQLVLADKILTKRFIIR